MNLEIWLDLDLKYLNFRINKIFCYLKKSIDSIEEKFCESIMILDIYIFVSLEINQLVHKIIINFKKLTIRLEKKQLLTSKIIRSFFFLFILFYYRYVWFFFMLYMLNYWYVRFFVVKVNNSIFSYKRYKITIEIWLRLN